MGGISRGSREEKQSGVSGGGVDSPRRQSMRTTKRAGTRWSTRWGPCSPHQPRRICRVLATRGGVRRGGAEVGGGGGGPESFIKPQQRRRDASDSDPLKTEPGSCRAPAKRGRRTQASEPGLRWGPRQPPPPSASAQPTPRARPRAEKGRSSTAAGRYQPAPDGHLGARLPRHADRHRPDASERRGPGARRRLAQPLLLPGAGSAGRGRPSRGRQPWGALRRGRPGACPAGPLPRSLRLPAPTPGHRLPRGGRALPADAGRRGLPAGGRLHRPGPARHTLPGAARGLCAAGGAGGIREAESRAQQPPVVVQV